jgi:peptide/nickel transport system substrate-binding protein
MRRTVPLLVAATVLTGALTACQGDAGTTSGAAFDPATCQGGTLSVLNQGGITHLDPARLYTSGGGNIPSLLFRTLTTRNRQPGEAGTKPAPDLATDLGTPSDGAKTWTYHLRDGIFFEDGTPITAADIKYGIERSFAPELPGGAPYLRDWLVDAAGYQGPYKQPDGIKAIETPDAKTIVFKLRKPEGDFPFLATATQFAPVPKAKDKGVDYENHPVSSGPYMVASYEKKKSLSLVRNPHWTAKSDTLRYACPDKIEVTSGLDAAVINQRLVTGAGQDANAVTTDAVVGPSSSPSSAPAPRSTSGSPAASSRRPPTWPSTSRRSRSTTRRCARPSRTRSTAPRWSTRWAAARSPAPSTTFLPPQAALGYQPYDYFPAGDAGDPAKAKAAAPGRAGSASSWRTRTTTPTASAPRSPPPCRTRSSRPGSPSR